MPEDTSCPPGPHASPSLPSLLAAPSKYPPTPLAWLIVPPALLALMTAGTYLLWRRDHTVVLENHFVEWLQVVFLVAAALVHAARGVRAPLRVDRIYRLAIGLLCVSLALREVDIHSFGPVWKFSVRTMRGLALAAWLVLFWRVIANFAALWPYRRHVRFSFCTAIAFLSGVILIASWPFDRFKLHIDGPWKLFVEEALELDSALLFFIGAWTPLFFPGVRPSTVEAESDRDESA